MADLEIQGNIIVLGYLAAIYCCGCGQAPIKHWGFEYKNRGVRVGDHFFTASLATREIEGKLVAGALLVKSVHYYGGGEKRFEKAFFPWSAFDDVSAFIQGMVVD